MLPANLLSKEDKIIPLNQCPECGDKMVRRICMNNLGARPTVGTPSICGNCGEMLQYTQELTLEKLPSERFAQFPDNIQSEMTAVSAHLKRHRK